MPFPNWATWHYRIGPLSTNQSPPNFNICTCQVSSLDWPMCHPYNLVNLLTSLPNQAPYFHVSSSDWFMCCCIVQSAIDVTSNWTYHIIATSSHVIRRIVSCPCYVSVTSTNISTVRTATWKNLTCPTQCQKSKTKWHVLASHATMSPRWHQQSYFRAEMLTSSPTTSPANSTSVDIIMPRVIFQPVKIDLCCFHSKIIIHHVILWIFQVIVR